VNRSVSLEIQVPIACHSELELFPHKFQTNDKFRELVSLIDQITSHQAMRVSELHVLENMIRASLLFTVCFYGNLLSLAYFVLLDLRGNNSFAVPSQTKFLHLILELASGELATKNIKTASGEFAPHYVSMLEAAQAAGIDTTAIEQFVRVLKHPDYTVEKAALQAGFNQETSAYLTFSNSCTENFPDCFATIALRELFLAEPFGVIVENLPNQTIYKKYEQFLRSHIEFDTKEHAILMSEALHEVVDVDRALSTMVNFLKLRKSVYDVCLLKRPLY
jgi:Protein of unknown function (DUF3050)